VEARLKKLNEVAPDHLTAKKLIQKKYFGFGELDDSIPLLAFVGRITAQKGVHLILDAAEHLIHKSGFKVNILVGGAVNMKEPYSAQCAHKMWALKNKYPNCFWADPNSFFTDGSLINRGTDFGLMPSAFEPGGIVQHEFFVGGTPVVAFKTGGLKDSVFEFNWDTEKGNGYTFESHNHTDFLFACERALGTYKNKAKYLKLRQNAIDSTMDGERVSREWLKEFFRLRSKVFVDQDIIKETLLRVSPWSLQSYKPMTSFEELFGLEKGVLKNFAIEDIDFGAEEEKEIFEEEKAEKRVLSHFEHPKDDKFPHVFSMHNNGPRYRTVELCGTFDNWKTRHPMSFDNYTNQWFINLHIGRGKYLYKYVIDSNKWLHNEKEPMEKDSQGNVNNVLNL
jgi:starch synthase